MYFFENYQDYNRVFNPIACFQEGRALGSMEWMANNSNNGLVYFSMIVKQAIIGLCKSRSNLFLEPTSTKQWE